MSRRASIKDVVESLGVPHTEVGIITASGADVDFNWLIASGVEVSVAGFISPVDVSRPTLLRPHAYSGQKFLADENVERLGIYLRLMGLDVAVGKGLSDKEIVEASFAEKRVVLSRDRALLKRSKVEWGRLVRADQPSDQLLEVVDFFGLTPAESCFNRCVRCNLSLEPVDKDKVVHLLQPKTIKYYDSFYICPECGRVYWKGSHHDRMKLFLRNLGLGGC